jgi:hypothetical protein
MWSIWYSVKGLHHKYLNMGVFATVLQSLYTSLDKSVNTGIWRHQKWNALYICCSFNGNLKRDRWPAADRLYGTIPQVVDSGGSIQFCWNYLVLIVSLMGNGKSGVPLCNFHVSMQLFIAGIICCKSRRTQRSTGPNLTVFKQ